jgi:uncharacterized protein (TIGR02266 family)
VGAERRRHPRLKLEIDVDITSGHNFFSTHTRDASAGGLFIETDLPLPIGSPLHVVIRMPGMPGLEVAAEVAWALTDEAGRLDGLGVRFLSMPERSRAAIQRFMAARAPMLFDSETVEEAEGAEEAAAPAGPPPLPRR